MAKIYPFTPHRYSEKAGNLQDLVTQPYDKITPELQSRYYSSSPHNLVRIVLGERFAADSETENVYTRAARYLEEWIADGILVRETEPCFFAYSQEFCLPDTEKVFVRKGFIGLGAVEDYSEGVVHRHEQTLSGPKKDRMEILRHTRAHFGQIFMLYQDPASVIDGLLDEVSQSSPLASVTDESGTVHRLWKVSHPAQIEQIQEVMSDKKLLIADGHHRYETALAFRKVNPDLESAGRVMMTFVNMYSPGLKVLATHRLVRGLAGLDMPNFLNRAGQLFRVESFGSLESLRRIMQAPDPASTRFGVLVGGSEKCYLLEKEPREGEVNVAVLHEAILRDLLGVDEEAVRDEKHLRYARGIDAAFDAVREGSAQLAFLLDPIPVEEIVRISFSGGVMPQKSTDFYPKLLSGLTIYKL